MTCLSCGADIPPERLAAMPDAVYCVECQPEPEPLRAWNVPEAMAEIEIEPDQVWGR